MVSLRLKLHRLPAELKNYVNQELLTEAHLLKISGLLIDSHFSPG
jgi:hypothetical protein